jgi:hypothetical protein
MQWHWTLEDAGAYAQGIPIPNGGAIASRGSNVMANLTNAKSSIKSVIDSLPPQK